MTIAGTSVKAVSSSKICMGMLADFDAGSFESETPRGSPSAAFSEVAAREHTTKPTTVLMSKTAFSCLLSKPLPGKLRHSSFSIGEKSAPLWMGADE